MGYYVEIRLNDSSKLTIAEFRQRFLDAGIELHPALTHPESPGEDRERYANDLMYSGGIISFYESANSTCGVAADARMSWGDSHERVLALVRELFELAKKVNATLYVSNGKGEHLIDESNLKAVVLDFAKGSGIWLGAFGAVNQTNEPQ